MNKKLWSLLLPLCITACVGDYYEETAYSVPYRPGYYAQPRTVEPHYDAPYSRNSRVYRGPSSRPYPNKYVRSRTSGNYQVPRAEPRHGNQPSGDYPRDNGRYKRPANNYQAP